MFNWFLESEYNCEIFLDEITKQAVDEYVKYLKLERNLAATSRNRYLASIRSLLTYCQKQGYVYQNIALLVENAAEPKRERTYLTKEEVERVIMNIEQPVIKAALQFMAMAGTRVTETCNITFPQLDLNNHEVHMLGKGNKERTLPLSDKLYNCLMYYLNYVRDSNSDNLFATKKTGSLSPQYCQRELKEAVERAGINKKVSCHVFRHSFATHMIDKDVDIHILQNMLGHESLRTTSIYLHCNKDEMKQAMNAW